MLPRGSSQAATAVGVLMSLALMACTSSSPTLSTTRFQGPLLTTPLQNGEAIIWYLGHSGWAVKTSQRLLIFDYVDEQGHPPGASLSTGRLTADQLRGLNVFVFVSHAHGDHYDARIVEWQQSLSSITYLFGWKALDDDRHVYFEEPRSAKSLDGMEVRTINHDFDGIPEAAFLVSVDGVVLYHAGDHGSVNETLNPRFKDNIDYLAQQTQTLDVAFVPVFGSNTLDWMNAGDLYTLEQLRPEVTMPMHCGGRELECELWAKEARARRLKTTVVAVKQRGDWFRYRRGRIVETSSSLELCQALEHRRPGLRTGLLLP